MLLPPLDTGAGIPARRNPVLHRLRPLIALIVLALSAPALADAEAEDAPAAPDAADSVAESPDADEPAETEPDPEQHEQPGEPEEPEHVSLSFQNTEMSHIARFLSERTGKSVVVHESVRNKRITVISTRTMPIDEAMQVLRGALLVEEVVIDEGPRIITLRPLDSAHFANMPLLGDDDDPAEEADKSRIVRKMFALLHYDPERMRQAVEPMVPDYGQVSVDPATRRLIVIDTAGNLERIAQVVRSLDVPAAGAARTEIFEIEHNDASWIVSIIRTMLGDGDGGRPAPRGSRRSGGAAEPVSIDTKGGPVILYPEMTRNWIITVAPTALMRQVADWIEELDQPEHEGHSAFDMYEVKFADADEIARQVQRTIDSHPAADLRDGTSVVSMAQPRRLIVFGSRRGRQLVRSLLDELDVEGAGAQVREVFELRHADAEAVAAQIEELFSGMEVTFRSATSTSYRRDPQAARVRVTHDGRRNTVTVVTDPSTMDDIRTIIRDEWDQPLTTDDVQPKVYRLEYADPVQLKEVLEGMFSRRQRAASLPFNILFAGSAPTEAAPVGRLFGQFSFQTLPGSNRLIVSTPVRDNYKVIDQLIDELDVPQEAGLPRLVELNHAYAENLAEQINAILSEPGTLAEIIRADRDLSREGTDTSVTAVTARSRGQQAQPRPQGEGDRDPGTMSFWWQRGRTTDTEAPASNLIGKIRVVPIVRRNALLILSPRSYTEPIAELVRDLDNPGMQVVIHAVIAEVQHDDTSSLGVRLASDPSIFDDSRLLDQSIGGGASAEYSDIFGGTFAVGEDTFARGLISTEFNANLLIQLLMREFNMQILLEPQLYTADNQQAEFFDGQDVSIQIDSQLTPEGTVNRSFAYASIGTRLRVRPHITQNGDVDLMINLELSRTVPGESVFGNPIFDRRETTTQVVVHDGQTIMLSGIIRQEDFDDVRKLPLLGDIPLLGAAFRSTERGRRNRELIAFITPQVIRNGEGEAEEAMRRHRQRLEPFRDTFQLPPHLLPDDDDANPDEPLESTGEPTDE